MWANAGTNGALPGRGGELSVEGLLLWMVVLKQRQAVWEMLIFVGLEQRQEPDGFESWTILDPSGAPTTTLSSLSEHSKTHAFALFDKRGAGAIPRESLGDLLRALGQNPTQAEVADLASQTPRDVDYDSFTKILHRPDGYKSAGSEDEFIRGFAVFDKDLTGHIGVGELRYVLTSLGEKLSDQEVDELLAGVKIGGDGNIDYRSFVREVSEAFHS
ncbi:MAG: hypothetical protein CYPHOPRED_005075 [Cyphobasidiales sp. Tagirdzhanova-0007]|nr:MAG: hypothetical protein CYPHOPRED_005075 [Cyphobasidiales sp. Tagirdzhanova-0007]